MASLLSREPVFERKIVHWLILVPCIESLPRLPSQKSFGLLKASGSQIYCSSSPRGKKPLESSESFDRASQKLNKPECFLLWLTKQRTFPTKKTFSVLGFVDSSKNIREEFSGFRRNSGNAIKELMTNSVHDLGLTADNCRGKSYDRAGNMAGRYTGALTLIQRQSSKFMSWGILFFVVPRDFVIPRSVLLLVMPSAIFDVPVELSAANNCTADEHTSRHPIQL